MTNSQLEQPTSENRPTAVDERQVTEHVLHQLGSPSNLYRLKVQKLWNNRFRVNVYCRDEDSGPIDRVIMTDSFFVTWTEDGPVSSPPITKRYE